MFTARLTHIQLTDTHSLSFFSVCVSLSLSLAHSFPPLSLSFPPPPFALTVNSFLSCTQAHFLPIAPLLYVPASALFSLPSSPSVSLAPSPPSLHLSISFSLYI